MLSTIGYLPVGRVTRREWEPGLLASLWQIIRYRRPAPALRPHGGRFGLPADFLIASDGRVLAVKYGEHADDHWSVDQLLDLARLVPEGRPTAS